MPRSAQSALLLLGALVLPAAGQTPPAVPGAQWPVATPAAVGLNPAVLDSIDAEIRAGRYGLVDRFLVIRRGRIAFDRTYPQDYIAAYGDSARVRGPLNAHDPSSPYNYFNPWWHPTYRGGDLHSLQSVTKTVTSVVIGTAVTRGEFPDLDTPILAFFDTTRVRHVDARKRRVTIRHLLTMTGGFDWNEGLPYTDPRNDAVVMENSYDWVTYAVDRPMAVEPGTRFNYSSGESVLLAHIFRVATGLDLETYAARHLFGPLGVGRWYWKRTPAGVLDTEGGLYLEARDLARIWSLFLRGGSWNGTRLLSAEWIAQSLTPAVPTGPLTGGRQYGYKWWLHPDPQDASKWLWVGSGFGGQWPVAFPALDMVVVFNGWNILPGRGGVPIGPMTRRLAHAVTGAGGG